jgi:hypothetical protein
MRDWNTGIPPNETLVEVEDGDKIIQVMAFYGRDGYRPHWTNEDHTKSWDMWAFRRWRPITK